MNYFLKFILIVPIIFLFVFDIVLAETDSINITQEVIEDANTSSSASSGAVIGGVDTAPVSPKIIDISLEPKSDSVKISWTTDKASLAVFSWGEDTEYSSGVISGLSFDVSHEIFLEGLNPDTNYFFKIELEGVLGERGSLLGQKFRTLKLPDIDPPSNIKDLSISLKGDDVFLSWENPEDFDFKSVRIMRSDVFYPLDPKEGFLVFDDNNTSLLDKGLEKNKVYYYTVFAYDDNLNYSSGAIVSIFIPDPIMDQKDSEKVINQEKEESEIIKSKEGDVKVEEPSTKEPSTKEDVKDPFIEFPKATETDSKIEGLSILDFKFIQEKKEVTPSEFSNSFKIKGDKNLKISLDYEMVPEVLKTIMVTLNDPDDFNKTFSFLLRVNEEKTAYEAEIAPLEKSGNYNVGIAIVDHKNQGIKKISSNISVITKTATDAGGKFMVFMDKAKWIISFLLVFLSVWTIFKISRRLNEIS